MNRRGRGGSDYCRISQDTACYLKLLQDTFIDIMFNRKGLFHGMGN